jgi:hypothetical protein
LLGQGGRGAREADQCESHETTETMNDLHVMGPRVEKRKGELPCGCSPSLSDIFEDPDSASRSQQLAISVR